MDKSLATEIIAVLWLIAASLNDGWFGVVCAVFFVENVIESVYFAFKERNQ